MPCLASELVAFQGSRILFMDLNFIVLVSKLTMFIAVVAHCAWKQGATKD